MQKKIYSFSGIRLDPLLLYPKTKPDSFINKHLKMLFEMSERDLNFTFLNLFSVRRRRQWIRIDTILILKIVLYTMYKSYLLF